MQRDLDTIQRNHKKIRQIASALKKDNIQPFPFVDSNHPERKKYPTVGDENAVGLILASTIQDFGFWYADEKGYKEPMYAKIYGSLEKGSDFHRYAWMRSYKKNQDIAKPEVQASMLPSEFKKIYRDDHGRFPLPMIGTRTRLANDYGDKMLEMGFESAKELLDYSENYLINNGKGFLEILDNFSGYSDPLRKKSNLVRMIFENRPEDLFSPKDPENKQPIIDYHLQRTFLRTGMVDPGDFRDKIARREWIDREAHDKIRREVYEAFKEIVEINGKSIEAVDYKLFSARRYCPEMSEPDCSQCSLSKVCSKQKEFFQPVYRTTYY